MLYWFIKGKTVTLSNKSVIFGGFEVKMKVNDLQSGCDQNFRVELTNLDLCANFHLPSFSRDFRAPDLNFTWKSSLNGTPPLIFSVTYKTLTK